MKSTSFLPGFGLALSSFVLSSAAMAQQAPASVSEDETQSPLQEVVVTGSLIPTAATHINPEITTITNQQLEDRGFKNAFDALNNLPQNTGFTQGADFGNTFTPAANTISLRGLGPNHTLILINGERVADYPVPYNGAVNFVNLADIPESSVDRIEVLQGGASAIYGSDAIAGVVNIILKDHYQGVDVDVKAGTTQHGGGSNNRVQVTGGGTFGNLSTVFSLEVSRIEPIWAEQRDFMTSTGLEGSGQPPGTVWQRTDLTLNNNLAPPGGCAPFAGLYQNSTALAMNSNSANGPYCGSGKVGPENWTTQTGNQGENFFGSVKYALNADTVLFGDVVLAWNHIWNNTRGASWTSDNATTGYFLNQNTGDYESWSRGFGPEEEPGGVGSFDQYFNDFSGILTAGIEGAIGGSSWKYKATYNSSVYTDHNVAPSLLASVDSYFLGPQLGTDSNGVPIYSPNTARFDQPLTPAQFGSLLGDQLSTNNSWLQTARLTANGDLFDLPAGPVGAAGDLEWGTQGFSEHPDVRINQGYFYNSGLSFPASGNRTHYAAAMEFNVPILSSLKADVAGRYDEYSYAGTSKGKPTINVSLDYRPISMLRVHASYATSFRAPDMNYIFQSKSFGYYSVTTDYYRCALAHDPLTSCPYANYFPGANYTQLGSHNLGFEDGRSFDYGVVFTPIEQVQLSADYWNLRIDNEVTLIDADALLRIESECRLGQLDPSSSQCVQALAAVQRNPPNAVFEPNQITNINIYPINAAYERTDGMDFGLLVRWNWDRIGQFVWNSTYTMVMSHWFDQGQGSQPQDLVRSFNISGGGTDFPNKATSTLTWSLNNLSSTVEVDRYGQIINQGQTAWLTPTSLVNWSGQYKAGNATFMVIIDNVFDTQKMDPSFGWPFYAVGYYSPYGRQGWLEFNYHFGPKG